MLSLAIFAPTALIILMGPSPTAVFEYFSGKQPEAWTQLGQRSLMFSLIADGLAWLTCLAACLLVVRLRIGCVIVCRSL